MKVFDQTIVAHPLGMRLGSRQTDVENIHGYRNINIYATPIQCVKDVTELTELKMQLN